MPAAALSLLMLLPQVSATGVQDLLQKLDADRFADRRAATQQLAEMGSAVFDDLAKAAVESDSREVQERALSILRNHFQNGEATIRGKAEAALDRIAEQDSPAGRQAKEILRPDEEKLADAQQQQQRVQQLQIARIKARIAANQAAQIKLRGAGGQRNVNRRIQVSTNGRKIKIEVSNGKIKMEIEETDKDGKKQTKKYEADSEEELKKKHPQAYQEYQRYAGRARAAIVPQNIPQRRAAPAVPFNRPVPQIPDATRKRILDALKKSEAQLDKETEKLKKTLKGDELQRALDSVKQRRERLQAARKRYEG